MTATFRRLLMNINFLCKNGILTLRILHRNRFNNNLIQGVRSSDQGFNRFYRGNNAVPTLSRGGLRTINIRGKTRTSELRCSLLAGALNRFNGTHLIGILT